MKKFSIYAIGLALICLGIYMIIAVFNPITTFKGIEANATIVEDSTNFIADGANAVFYESQIEFDKEIDTTDTLTVVSVKNVFQKVNGDTVFIFNHSFVDNQHITTVDTLKGFWVEDLATDVNVTIDLAHAIDSLKSNNIVTPHTRFVTLRKPVCPVALNSSFYVFGTANKTDIVVVNSTDGSVDYAKNVFTLLELNDASLKTDTVTVVTE